MALVWQKLLKLSFTHPFPDNLLNKYSPDKYREPLLVRLDALSHNLSATTGTSHRELFTPQLVYA